MKAGLGRLMKRCAYLMLAAVARVVCLTLRIRRVNAGPIDALLHAPGERCVIAFWHGSMIPGWFFHRPRKKRRVSALVSLSKDGTILASVLEAWGFTLIRGSSHIGGKEALHLMTDAVEHGSTLCVTPDGPTGPRHVMKAGAALVAGRTGVPLVIAGIAVKNKKVLARSWDKFEIPMPFSEVCIWYDEPIMVPAPPSKEGRTDAERERLAFNAVVASIGERLARAHTKAHEELGIEPVAYERGSRNL